MNWLLQRMAELQISLTERPVSTFLWDSFMKCQNAQHFAEFMSNAEERGRIAGERFRKEMAAVDSVTADLFGKIAEEEIEHIQLAGRYFPVLPNPPSPRIVSDN